MLNSWICVDASLIVRMVMNPEEEQLQEQWEQWEADGYSFMAPSLLYYEVTNAIYQYRRHEHISSETTEVVLEAVLSLPVKVHGDRMLHRQALKMSERFSLPATYDSHYLALAARHGADLWTADRRLFNAVQSDLSWVHLWE